MDLRHNLEAGRSEGGTGKEAHGKPVKAQDADAKVLVVIGRQHDIQGEKSGGGDLVISG